MTHSSYTTKRWISGGLMLVFVLGLVGVGLFSTRQTLQAQGVIGDPVDWAAYDAAVAQAACLTAGMTPANCPPRAIHDALVVLGEKIKSPAFRVAVIQGLINVSRFVLDRLAYEAAVAIASGGPGEGSLFYNKTPAEAFGQLGLEAAGEAVATLSDLTGDLGYKFNLCSPDGVLQIALAIGIKQKYQPTAPRCDILEVGKAWGSMFTNLYQTISDPAALQEAVLSKFAESLKPGQNEISAALRTNIAIDGKVRELKLLELMGITKDEYKPVTDFLTGDVKTPSATVTEDFHKKLSASEQEKVKVGDLVSAGDLIGGLALTTASTFTNTLLSTLFTRIYTGLFDVSFDIDPFDVEAISEGGKEAAQERFASIITTNPIAMTEYNALGEFVVCVSGNVTNRGLNNCVMDTNFMAAVSRGSSGAGAALTVQEAIDEGLLNGDWPLISPEDTSANQDPYCYTYGYCYGNLVKLRKARVIPVGWELAALRNDSGSPATLQEVVDGFDDCTEDGTIGPANSSSGTDEWCHLIDPNWVLKYPETQCRAIANGEIRLGAQTPGRASSCVDAPSCIGEDNDGNCSDGYGYCVREKNTWRFRGDECPEEYSTCLSFENTFTGDQAAYRVSTVDYSVCDSDNAGCRWYATQKHYEDAGTGDDDSDDSYEWLPDGETYITTDDDTSTPDHDSAWKYQHSTGDTVDPEDFSYTSDSGTTYTYSSYAYTDRIYFTNEAEECTEDDIGCTGLNEFDGDLVFNQIQNPSFEDDEDDDDFPDNWITTTATTTQTMTEEDFVYGSFSFSTDSSVLQQYVSLTPHNFYTLSFQARADDSSTGTASVSLSLTDEYGTAVSVAGTSYGGDCEPSTSSYSLSVSTTSTTWTQYDCTFTTPEDVAQGLLSFSSDKILLDAVQLELGEDVNDFTEGYSTSPIEVFYQVAPDYLGCTGDETDPDACDDYAQVCNAQEVGCNLYTPEDGDPDVPAIISELDECPEECVGYTTYKQEATDYDSEEFPLYFIADRASACSSQYVGCDSYTNLDAVDAGGEGTEDYSALRFCLSEDIVEADSTDDSDAATFFTWEGSDNEGYQLQTWYLLESGQKATSGTFSGSGYVESRADLAPCTHVTMSSENQVVCSDRTSTNMNTDVWDNTECDEHDDIFDNPDCREFFDATSGNIHYREYPDTISISDECAPYRKDESTEDDCTDSGGYWTDQGFCRYYVLAEESTSCPAEQSGCREYTGGTGRNATTILDETFEDGTYDDFVIFESGSTSTLSVSNESVATDGHSLYVSASGGLAGFETIQIYLDSASTTSTYDEETPATCTGTVGDSGCDVEYDVNGDSAIDEDCTIEDGQESCGTLTSDLVGGKTFVVDFWAKGSGNLYVSMDETGGTGTSHDLVDPASETTISQDPVELTGSWQLFSLGPLDTSSFTTFDENAVLRFAVAAGVEAYIDNITLKQVEEDITIIKDSWVVPSTCDATADGVESDQYYLGCEAYTDQNGADANLYQFTSLCSEEVVGCEGFYDTGNSDSEYEQVYNARCMYSNTTYFPDGVAVSANTTCEIDDVEYCTISVGSSYCTFDADEVLEQPLPLEKNSTTYFLIVYGPETVIVPADAPRYLVADDTYECDEEAMGCQELGLPTFNQDQSEVESFESVYYLNVPEDYDTLLCSDEELFCEEWDSTQDGNFYFKDPIDKTCEYQDSITLGNQEYSGWFRTGTTEPCYWSDDDASGDFDPDLDDSYLINGNEFGVWTNGDDDYDGWVAACEDAYDLCTEFVDVVDTAGGGGEDGESYYFTNDDLLSEDTLTDNQRCNGQVSQKFGCAVFNNTTESELSYNAGASYVVSMHADVFFGEEQNSLQDPVDCELDEGGEFTVSSSDKDVLGLSSETVDLCARRCSYEVEDGDSIDTPSATYVSATQYYERSCLVDDDCPVLTSDLGEDVTATCGDVTDPYALDDDANEVIKVNRDRSCSAWLACESSKTSWNTTSSTYDTICDSINLCVEGTNQGDSSSCSQWDASDPEILSAYQYSARDVNWFGEEWSGGTIPNQLPTDVYTQFNLEPQGVCSYFGGFVSPILDDETGLSLFCNTFEDCPVKDSISCDDNSDCASYSGVCSDSGYCYYSCETNSATDYRLVYDAGPCDSTESGDGNGGSCLVGTCEDSGSACASDDDCSVDEECVVGYFQATGSVNCTNSDCSCNPDDNARDGANVDCSIAKSATGVDTNICDPAQFVCVDVLTSDEVNRTSCTEDSLKRTCVPASTSTIGSCFNNRCLSDIKDDNGDGYADALVVSGGEVTSGRQMSCRGYPEIDSPYPTSVVDNWKTFSGLAYDDTDSKDDDNDGYIEGDVLDGEPPSNVSFPTPGGEPSSWYSLAYSFVGGFQDSTVCGLDRDGNPVDCDCSYDKAEYGEGSGYRYYQAGTGASSGDVPQGICSGGPVPGIPCVGDKNCTIGDQIGTCTSLSGVSTLYGWEGYCIEKDTSIQTLGSSNTDDQACLSWLPVDQLAGSTDLYGKYTSAGYTPQDTYYCADVALAYDVETTQIGCAEATFACDAGSHNWESYKEDAKVDDGETAYNGCLENIFCPSGYFAMMGGCGVFDEDVWGGEPDDFEGLNGYSEDDGYCTGVIGGEDCPYFCVPKFSYKTKDETSTNTEWTDGARCDTPGNVAGFQHTDSYNADDFGNATPHLSVYVLKPEDFIASWKFYNDCKVKGVLDIENYIDDGNTFSDLEARSQYDFTTSSYPYGFYYNFDEDEEGIRENKFFGYGTYPVCETLVQVSSAQPDEDDFPFNSYNSAWTDRLWSEQEDTKKFSIAVPFNLEAYYGYMYATAKEPFGAAQDYKEIENERSDENPDPYAHRVVMCYDTDTYLIEEPAPVDPTVACATGYKISDTQGEDARSYQYISVNDEQLIEIEEKSAANSISLFSQIFGRLYGMIKFNDGYDDVAGARVSDGELLEGFKDGEPFGTWEELELTDSNFLPEDDVSYKNNDWIWDTRSVGDDDNNPVPPVVVSVGDCVGTECSEDTEGKFNIGEVDSGDLEGEGTYHAAVSFFAYADSDQMPIRRIVMDWGDDFSALNTGLPWDTGSQSGSIAPDNYYKNHRGLGTSDKEICSSSADEFGKSTEACSTSYVNFSHDYICTAGDVSRLNDSEQNSECKYDPDTGRLLNSPCLDSNKTSCVFQPRVNVTDNWGWCTGFCDAGEDRTVGCFSGKTEDGEDVNEVKECDIINCPSERESSSCDDSDGGIVNPWINFDGTIVVTPD